MRIRVKKIILAVALGTVVLGIVGCGTSTYSGSSSSSSSTKATCGYKYPDGSICGAKVGSHAPLCDKHFNELNSSYEYYFGSLE